MTPELIDYLLSYYPHLFSNKEKAAYKHHNTLLKPGDSGSRVKDAMMKHWATDDKETLILLKNGYENFKRTVAERIFKDCSTEIVINSCLNVVNWQGHPKLNNAVFCECDWHVNNIE